MDNFIKTLFYNCSNDKILEIEATLISHNYILDYKLITDFPKLKSEIMYSGIDILVLDYNLSKNNIEEIIEFINDLNKNIYVFISIDSLDSELVHLALQYKNTDVILKPNINQSCLALIRAFQKQKDAKQSDFTRKELIRSHQSQLEHEHFLNQIIESTTNPIFYKGTNGRYLGCNNAFADILGKSKEEIIGKTVFEVSPADLAQRYHEMDEAFFKNPETQEYEYRISNTKGDLFDVLFYKSAIKDEEGNVVGLLGHMFNITDRKNLEREIYKEKEIAELILDTSDTMYVMLDLEGNITGVNKKACQILKAEKNNLIKRNWFDDFLLDEDREKVRKVFNDILNQNYISDDYVKNNIINDSKEKRLIHWLNKPLRNPDGELVGLLCSGRDMSNKDQLEIDLAESEGKYRSLVENMQEGLGIVDLNEIVRFCNTAFDKVFGLNAGETIGKDLKNYVLDEDLSIVLDQTDKRRGNTSSEYKVRIKREDGSIRTLKVSAVPWKNNLGEVIGTYSMLADITAQEYAINKLEKKTTIEQSIVNISSQFISPDNFNDKLSFTLNELTNIIAAERYGILLLQNGKLNLATEHFDEGVNSIGVDFESVSFENFQYSLGILESFDFIFYDNIKKLPDEAKSEKELFDKYKIFNFLGIPFYSDAQLSGLVIINNIYEVTEWTVEDLSLLRTIADIIGHAFSRNKAEEKVKQLHQDIITKNNELEQVVYVTSHDIRSPVVNILGFSDEMVKALNKLTNKIFDEANQINNADEIKYLLEKDVPQILNFIKISGQKIDKLLIALLKLSRLGRAALNKVQVDMNQLVQNAVKTFEYQINQDNIEVVIDDLPTCYTDEVAINQVFSNLIDNAIKYRSLERDTKIKITASEENGKVTYCISDNGIGIAQTELDKIFDVFYRINPENQNGEGMGLSLIKKTIDRVDGKISVGSELGKGTQFYITLEKQMT